ncbi:MAG: outer rane lipase/esterase, partial [Methylobacteriaceae bacterium]|nr:outer rane lipase/esterase [Methylobacteriaceae bacterium]
MIGTGIKRRIRSAVCAGVLLAGSAVASQAQSPFTSVYGFGDSYADIGNLFRITHTFSPIYPTGRFSGGT